MGLLSQYYKGVGDDMCLQHLIEAREELQHKICQHLIDQLRNLTLAGENMAECATNIQGHGYSSFILARDFFMEQTRNLREEIEQLNTVTH